ncbi:MAG TPA: hypothetical protein VF659_11980 [Pyrinomonadaceae bacterium]|jgi:hypothetical protein
MKRRLATALTTAALLALSVTAWAGAQTEQGPARTGERNTKTVLQSCPVHPEFKARSAGKCPQCRAEERKMKSARDKDKGKVSRPPQQQQEEGSPAND